MPPSAAGIAGSRPGAMFWICRSSHGGFQFSALRAECLFTRPSGALQMCRLRRRRLPGPAPTAVFNLPRCARRGFRCAPRLRRAPQSGDAHSKRATGATCPFGTNGVPIRAVASRPLWIPRRESPCDPALRAGTLSGAAFGGKNRERVPPRGGFGFSALRTDGLFRAPPGRFRGAACGGIDCRDPPRRAGRLLARPRSRRKKGAQGDFRQSP